MTDAQLNQAIALIRAGERDQARNILLEILKHEPTQEKAWLWLVETLSNDTQRVAALEECLRYNPDSQMAKKGLQMLMQQAAKLPSRPAEIPTPEEVSPQPYQWEAQVPVQLQPEENEPSFSDRLKPLPGYEYTPNEVQEPQLEDLLKSVDLPPADEWASSRARPATRRRRRRSPWPFVVAFLLLVVAGGLIYATLTGLFARLAYFAPAHTLTPFATTPEVNLTSTPAVSLTPTRIRPTRTPTLILDSEALTLAPSQYVLPTPLNSDFDVISADNADKLAIDTNINNIPGNSAPVISAQWDHLMKLDGPSVAFYDPYSGVYQSRLERSSGTAVLAVLSADGKQAATYNDDQTIMIWDMTNAKPPRVYETKGDVSSLVFSPNGNYVASVVNNQKVVVWDLSMDRPAVTYESTALSGQSGMEIQFLENGQLMVVDRDLNTQAVTVNIYQTPDTTPLKTFKEDARSFGLVKVAPKDHFLVAVGGGELKVFTLPAGEAIAKMEALLSADNRPMFVFSQDGYNVAVETKGVPQGVIWARVYDLQTGSQNAHCETDFVSVAGMTFSPDGNLLAMIGQSQAGGPYYLEVFDTNGGAQYTDLALDAQTVPLGITFTPDQTQIALMVKGGIQFYRVKQ